MGNLKTFSTFSLALFLALSIAFALHLSVLSFIGLPLLDNMIIACYLVNFALALLIFLGLYLLRERMKNQIGFLFMAGSLFKFLVFFLVFYPRFLEDGTIGRAEFAAFFVPYAVSLIIETAGVARLLQKSDHTPS